MTASISLTTLDKFSTFGDLLRFLRRRVGITQIELATAVGYSDTQISRLEQNLRLPDIPTIQARFISALDLEEEPNTVARLLDLAAHVRREDSPGLGLCPYKGLDYFDESDADLFVGREMLTTRLIERVFSLPSSRPRFFAIVGASGSGKSSLVRAGLVSALRWNQASTDWHIHVLTPTSHPLESLAASLTQGTNSVVATATLMDDLVQEPRSLQLFAKRKLGPNNGSRLLLVIDQFEELFALCRSEKERVLFIENLLTAASEADGPVVLLITLRADFYAHCANYTQLREALAKNQEYIGAMSDAELRRAIEEPARRGRWEFEPGLVDLLLHDVGHEPGALPLLSHALLETWQRRRGRTMTLSGYASSGGVRGAIAETAETVFSDQFTQEQRTIARRIFLRLTELGDESGAGDTRRRATFNELILKPEERNTTRAVLKALADARLITTSESAAEVAHEALIREWPTLHGWLEENREGLRLHRHLTEAAQEWLKEERSADLLYRGARLAQAREWALTHESEMNELEGNFLSASIEFNEREVKEREAQRQRELEAAQKLAEAERQYAEIERQRAAEQMRTARQLRTRAIYLTGALIFALLMAVTASFFSVRSRQAALAAQEQQRIAYSRELSAASSSNLDVDPERSILLALKAIDVTDQVKDPQVRREAEEALHLAVLASHVRLSWAAHQDSIWALAYSPDGKHLVTASQDGTAKLWDPATGQELLTLSLAGEGGVGSLAFSPDGTRLAVSTDSGKAYIWDAMTGERLLTLSGHSGPVWSIAFSPDGRRLATGSLDRTAILWDAITGEKLQTLTNHPDAVIKVAFSPNDGGARLATSILSVGSVDDRVKIWDSTKGKLLFEVGGFGALAFSPDGMYIATAWPGNTIEIANATTGESFLSLAGHTSTLNNVIYSPDGHYLATVSDDRTARVWDAATGREVLTLYGHLAPINGIAFSPDGEHLATSDEQGVVRIWDIGPEAEIFSKSNRDISSAEFHRYQAPSFGADNSHVYTIVNTLSADENTVTQISVLDAALGKDLRILAKTKETVFSSLAVSRDGARVAVGGQDGILRILDGLSGKLLWSVNLDVPLNNLAFSPDGKWLATPGEGYAAQLWDVNSGQLLFRFSGHSGVILDLAFSQDGKKLATSSFDQTVKVWDLSNRELLYTLRGHPMLAVFFHPDGKQLATTSMDGAIQIWDVTTGSELDAVTGHTSVVSDVAFSSDGKWLSTAGGDGTLKLWDTSTHQLIYSLPGGEGGIAFSPDGRQLVTVSNNGSVLRMYYTRTEDLQALAQRRLTRTLTLEECIKYLHLEACPSE
ncbi:MAG TPA: AAA family ATPase [Anaerolineales bacterium]|nr:AAA family ATPase [Anaerolineales bacterium]